MTDIPKPIFLVAGARGGSGTSFLAMLVTNRLVRQGQVAVVDHGWADVARCFPDLPNANLTLETLDSCAQFVDFCQRFPSSTIVVNCVSKPRRGVAEYFKLVRKACKASGRSATILWALHRMSSDVDELQASLDAFPESPVHVLRNPYPRTSNPFQTFEQSMAKQLVLQRGGSIFTMPVLGDSVSALLFDEEKTFDFALSNASLGERMQAQCFDEEMTPFFEALRMARGLTGIQEPQPSERA